MVSIILFPVLVIITICCIRNRNIRAREKRIKDWAKENRITKGIFLLYSNKISGQIRLNKIKEVAKLQNCYNVGTLGPFHDPTRTLVAIMEG